MATKARQQYHADEVTLSKDRREFSISDDVQEKIDWIEEGAQVNTIETIRVNWNEISPDENKAIDLTIPWVIDSLSSTSITDALSARQWKILYDKIDNVSRIWHFLALWDASTWLPVTDPETSPYEYHAGDFYIISVVASQWGTNYKPSWTEYISWQASTAVETDDVEVNDFYFYDGQVWRHMKNSWAGDVVVDGSLSTTSRNPVENRVITNALSWKQNTLTAWANIQINWNTISATDTKYTAGTWISIANWVISNTQTSAERWNITGTLSDQTDLQTVLTSKATDANVVHKSWAETIAWTKTFSTSPVVPSKTTAATNTGTAIATEAQVYKKQDTLVSGTNIKTINSNSLLGSWNITLNDVKSSATAPSSPTEWMLWYDTTNDVLKAYNGTQWNAVDTNTTYNAGEWIKIWTYNDYSAMRWPCPEGFHVPSQNEWVALCWILTTTFGLSNNMTTLNTYLKMPSHWYRSETNGSITNSSITMYYWSSTRNADYAAGSVYATSSAINLWRFNARARWFNVRWFRDKPIIPDGSWVTLYDWSSVSVWAGIFHNLTLWLISVSWDGINWTTIADKNLWASTVYNNWDTVTDSNCGGYFQWGNNYMFPFSWSVTTSSTKVDATGYWPWNYYSSDIFITPSDSPKRRENPENTNLRWWTTWVVTIDNVISNTGVLSVNGQTWDVTIPTAEESNTKTFYLSSTSDLTNAQAAYDWWSSWKNSIIIFSWVAYFQDSKDSTSAYYYKSRNEYNTQDNKYTLISLPKIKFNISSWTVTSVLSVVWNSMARVLATNVDYSTPYTPEYPWSPATKKYVDDRDTYIGSSEPTSNKVEWRLWYDTTNDQLKVYDWTNWGKVGTSNIRVFETTNRAVLDWWMFNTDADLTAKIQEMWERLLEDTNHIAYIAYNIWHISSSDIDYRSTIMRVMGFHARWIGDYITYNFEYIDTSNSASWWTWSWEVKKFTGNIEITNGSVITASINKYSNPLFIPSNSWTTGQVLTKTASGYNWQDASWWFELAPNSPLNPKYRRYWTQAQYDALTQYYTEVAGDTVYFTI